MASGTSARLACANAAGESHHEEPPALLIIHYYTFAYTLVIAAYVFGFGEYVYFRLTSILHPEKVIYHSTCEKRSNEVIGKNALHYVIVLVAFVSVAFFQIICFFGLTISEKWTQCSCGSHIDPLQRLRLALAKRIRDTMEATVYPAFACYGISSVIVCGMIFYMVGVRDSIDQVAYTVSLYIFDFILLVYFLSFPVIAYIYHPFIRRRRHGYGNPGYALRFVQIPTKWQRMAAGGYWCLRCGNNDWNYCVLLPLVAMCSLLGMYLPRSSVLMFAVCLTYLMMCLLKVISLMRNLFGSRAELSGYLTTKQQEVLFSTPPLCCCCKCLPKAEATEDNLRHVEWMVNQSPVARLTLEVARIVSFLEHTNYETVQIVIIVCEVISMMTATWGCQILTRLSQKKLDKFRFGTIFTFVNATQAFFTLQKLLFDLIAALGGFGGENTLTPAYKAYFWNNFTMTIEMFLIGILATVLVNPKRSALFDRYNVDLQAAQSPLAELSERKL